MAELGARLDLLRGVRVFKNRAMNTHPAHNTTALAALNLDRSAFAELVGVPVEELDEQLLEFALDPEALRTDDLDLVAA